MNYLGHLFVAGDDPELKLGGLLGDFVRGRDLSAYPEGVARGISLHRAVDAFTDQHPAFRSACALVTPEHRRFSGILVDIFFGHLLARDWLRHHSTPLASYAAEVYGLWRPEPEWLSERASRALAAMSAGDWLSSYATLGGTEAALRRVDHRLAGKARLVDALPQLVDAAEALEDRFADYLPAVTRRVKTLCDLEGSQASQAATLL